MRKTVLHSLGSARVRGGTLSLLLLVFLAADRSAAQSPGAVDPLSTSEAQTAATTAQNNSQVRALLGTGPQVLGSVDFVTLSKGPADNEDPSVAFNIGRFALVTFCRYSGNLGVSAIVNLSNGGLPGDFAQL